MAIPDPRTTAFAPAPAGSVRVVAWRQRTESWPHPDLGLLHADRAALLHRWAEAQGLDVGDWGETDAARPAEFVQVIVKVAGEAASAGLAALVTGSVKAFFDYRKSRHAAGRSEPSTDELDAAGDRPPGGIPLLAVTIVNEAGGTVVVMNAPKKEATEDLIEHVLDITWSDRQLVI